MADTGTVTITKSGPGDSHNNPGGLVCHDIAWIADGSGDAELTTSRIQGTIVRQVYIPSGTAAPTDQYDMTLVDRDSIDVLQGHGANLDVAVTKEVLTSQNPDSYTGSFDELPFPTCGKLVFAVANAGAAGAGLLRLFVRP